MHAERDYLQKVVFPALEERLRERRCHFEPIDLRWGVETATEREEHAKQLLVLKVCLAEVERSRPFLIGLLGDRYGWVPPVERATAAANEAGFEGAVAGRSLTDLEIEFGVLASSVQRQRCLFYFREPLPYNQMGREVAANYSERHRDEPGAEEAARKLEMLKQRIEANLPGRVHRYRARWDLLSGSVTGLDKWGRDVLEDLWRELDAETAERARRGEPSWQEAERWTLEQFFENRARGFVGRAALLEDLLDLARSKVGERASCGACVTGPAGSGKSALIAEMWRRINADGEALVLTNAAGISPLAGQVDRMLRRWVEELGKVVGYEEVLEEEACGEAVEGAFHRLLGRVSTDRRVVLLLDALDQFEPTPRARYLTWLPKLWPPNARLIATAIPGQASQALVERPGLKALDLPPLGRGEAAEIARSVCRRYHREIHTDVLQALLARRTEGRTAAAGNPLWLELAVEELNLLDADDFARADQEIEGGPEERLHKLLLAVVRDLPADVPSLYGWMIDRAEELLGKSWARAFVDVIAMSRAGFREADLRSLMPELAGEAWDDLRFAVLRRVFRAHVVQRGTHAQWDFAHAQMRLAVRRRNLKKEGKERELHRAIAKHLEALSREDPLHESETMVHLIGADDHAGAARYYGRPLTLTEGEQAGATRALTDHVLTGGLENADAGLEWVISLLQAPGLDQNDRWRWHLCRNFIFDLHDALQNEAQLNVRHRLLIAVKQVLEGLPAEDPVDADLPRRYLSVCYMKLGDVLRALGETQRSLEVYRAALTISEHLAAQEPTDPHRQQELATNQVGIGKALMAIRDLPRALETFRTAVTIKTRLAVQYPEDIELHNLSAGHIQMGDVLLAQGEMRRAAKAYGASLAIRKRLANQDPNNVDRQHHLASAYTKTGDALMARGKTRRALKAFRAALAILERLADQNPAHALYQMDLAASHARVGHVLVKKGLVALALEAYRASLGINERLAAQDPTNVFWRNNIGATRSDIGYVFVLQGDFAGACEAYRAALRIAEQLFDQDPSDARWVRALVDSSYKLGFILRHLNDPEAAQYWRRCHETLLMMREAGVPLDPPLTELLNRFEANAHER
jgi:tetratricopeptide (TPR) repeat protein